MALALILDRIVQECCDRLIFIATVLPDHGADADQVSDVGHGFALALLAAVELVGPGQGSAVALGDDHEKEDAGRCNCTSGIDSCSATVHLCGEVAPAP